MLIKRITIFLVILFWFIFGLWNALDVYFSGIFYVPVIGFLPFILVSILSGWSLARYGTQKYLLINVLIFSIFAALPFFLMGVQDMSTWRIDEQMLNLLFDFSIIFFFTLIIGEIRILLFKRSVLPLPPDFSKIDSTKNAKPVA